jgi:hypothetical protein
MGLVVPGWRNVSSSCEACKLERENEDAFEQVRESSLKPKETVQ